MDATFRVIAIVSAFNEGDIISKVIEHLIESETMVYLLDNHSTDDTVDQAATWLGKGLLHIERFPVTDDESGKFQWSAILRRKEELSRELAAEWFIHHDADEIRDGPWPGLNLKESIRWVDQLGYNCINFRVINFPPIDDGFKQGVDPRTYFTQYEESPELDKVQLKCWKAGHPATLVPFGGHEVIFEGRRIFPIPFLLRHYPIRGHEHGVRKVFLERRNRFVETERQKGWHRQYDEISELHRFVKDPATLCHFDLDRMRLELQLPDTVRTDFDRLASHWLQYTSRLEQEISNLRQHVANLDQDREQLRQHASRLIQDLDGLRQHVANLELDREQLRQQGTRLVQDLDDRERHVAKLELDNEQLRQNAVHMTRAAEDLRRRIVNLEQDYEQLRQKAAEVDGDRTRIRRQAEWLEQARQLLEDQKSSLERELERIHNSLSWRLTSGLRRIARVSETNGKSAAPVPSAAQTVFSSVDLPGESTTTVVDTCLIRGWTCSAKGIDTVSVCIDGKPVLQLIPYCDRPDVAIIYPHIPGAGQSGFDATLNLGPLSPGIHSLQVDIRDRSGSEAHHERLLQVL
jgi:predicted  nucleic acid-binding Zn-ribbon protein